MRTRVISFGEIEERFRAILTELEHRPRDDDQIIDMGNQLLLALRLCISQMTAPSSGTYPEKAKHLEILQRASSEMTYKLITCTADEIADQVPAAYRAFGAQS